MAHVQQLAGDMGGRQGAGTARPDLWAYWPGSSGVAGNTLLGLDPSFMTSFSRKYGSWLSRSYLIPSSASGQGQTFLNPPCVPNFPLKTFQFQAVNLNLSPYKANPSHLNIGENLLLSLLQ